MSEYIVELTADNRDRILGLCDGIHNEIVRCKDCRFSFAHGNGCGRNQDIYDAEPDGFCKWGEQRGDAE